MSAREPMAVPAQALTAAGMALDRAMDSPARSVRSQANCGTCGQAWFGEVAYCPYCGRPSASAPAHARADAPRKAGPPRMRWKAWGKPVAAVAAVLLAVGIPVNESAVTSDRAGPQGAGGAPVPPTAAVIAPSLPPAAAAPLAPPAPPLRNRSLCSAANEAAGLCNPH